jgi:hypothetical protein
LQAYIVQNIGRKINVSLDKILLEGSNLEWLGNEVSCGVGMQRIDIMLSLTKDNNRKILPIELKSVEASVENVVQIQRYVDWLEQYYIPNRISDIQPVLISRKIPCKTSTSYLQIAESFKKFNKRNQNCLSLKYIEYELIKDELQFEEVNY